MVVDTDIWYYSYELVRSGGGGDPESAGKPSSNRERIQVEDLHRDLAEAAGCIEMLKSEKAEIEAEGNNDQKETWLEGWIPI